MPSTDLTTYLPGNSNDYHNFQQLMSGNASVGNGTANKTRLANIGLGSASNNGTVNNNNKMPYPFLPPPPSQPLNAQNPLSPTNSPMSSMSNQSGLSVAQQQSRSFGLDHVTGAALESNSNRTPNQSNSTDQSSTQQHNSMLSPTRHLPFPYSSLNNYHRNF